jgi:hypothetical protein
VRYLTRDQALAALRRGAGIEQLLQPPTGDGGTVRWLSLARSDSELVLRLHAVHDEGTNDFFDVYEFTPVDEEEYAGEGTVIGQFRDPTEALDAASDKGARGDRWVNCGVVQDEYADSRGSR